MIQPFFQQVFNHKSVCILGFGREGKSTYHALQKYAPDTSIIIADNNPKVVDVFEAEFGFPQNVSLYCGPHYLDALPRADIILKSPGISLKIIPNPSHLDLRSQTDVFLNLFRHQVIGITGTKGKSTTTSLLYHIFQTAGRKVLLAGNIGIPPFVLFNEITPDATIVYEMSSHQLQNVRVSPHTAILLNIFQEHLDHYTSYKEYQLAKMNIARWQQSTDNFIVNHANAAVKELLTEVECHGEVYALNSKTELGNGVRFQGDDLVILHNNQTHVLPGIGKNRKLQGEHNLINIGAACLAAHIGGIGDNDIVHAVASFQGLAHRLEFIREWKGIKFYNDSISTIPEATIEAIKTFPAVSTILLGGYDRGIDYTLLVDFLQQHPVEHLIFIGEAGARILRRYQELVADQDRCACYSFNDFEPAVQKAAQVSKTGRVCLLSPAASSYDMFKNFEERGDAFRRYVMNL